MAINTYECKKCKRKFEEFSKKGKVIYCPLCGYHICQKLISKTSPPKFNGSGFHCNDYKTK